MLDRRAYKEEDESTLHGGLWTLPLSGKMLRVSMRTYYRTLHTANYMPIRVM